MYLLVRPTGTHFQPNISPSSLSCPALRRVCRGFSLWIISATEQYVDESGINAVTLMMIDLPPPCCIDCIYSIRQKSKQYTERYGNPTVSEVHGAMMSSRTLGLVDERLMFIAYDCTLPLWSVIVVQGHERAKSTALLSTCNPSAALLPLVAFDPLSFAWSMQVE
jgi:hypothetical protein